jgi:hypothetical protein
VCDAKKEKSAQLIFGTRRLHLNTLLPPPQYGFFEIYTKIVENSGRIFKCSINLMQCDCRFDLAAMPNEES